MTGEMGCEQVRELGAELALGIAAGDERDAALRHLNSCAACRRLVAELSSVGDELLQLAPEQEPPMGFESRVLAKLAAPPRRRPLQPLTRRSRWAMAAAAAVLVAARGAGSVHRPRRDDGTHRDLRPLQTLELTPDTHLPGHEGRVDAAQEVRRAQS